MYCKIKTTHSLIEVHETTLFNPKGKIIDTRLLMITTIHDINREILNNIHPDLLIHMVLIMVQVKLLFEIHKLGMIKINMQ